MQALLSGTAGLALVFDSRGAFRLSADSPEELVPWQPEDWQQLSAAAADLRLLSSVTLEQVAALLRSASGVDQTARAELLDAAGPAGGVALRPLVESAEFLEHPSPLAFCLGRDAAGASVIGDLATMPHLLVAGAYNTGKTTCLHALIVSLLLRNRPEQVRFLLVDPKRMELSVYAGLPQLAAPILYTAEETLAALRAVLAELERRYELLAAAEVRNVTDYNAAAAAGASLPRLVIVIDELADLMMQARGEVEFALCRLAQLGRAVGMHLVVATQRPSVKVLTGNLKANLPCRIALALGSAVDSRAVLDATGAETLGSPGEMLYWPLQDRVPRRLQGAFVSEEEIERVAQACRAQGAPQYLLHTEGSAADQAVDERDDDEALLADAIGYVIGQGEASVSGLQRHYRIGYARAGRLMDLMEARGIVGPSRGAKPREVLVSLADLEAEEGKE